MKILVVQESDWIEKGPHQSHHLMERLSTRGHDIRVIDFEIMWRNNTSHELISRRRTFPNVSKATQTGRTTVIRPGFLAVPILDYMSLSLTHGIEIRRQLDEFRPDAVVGFGLLNAFLAQSMARNRGVPFIYYVIDELHRLVPQEWLRGIACVVERRNMRNADLVISINEELRRYTVQMGASDATTRIITAGVDNRCFQQRGDVATTRAKLGIADDELVLFFMGWLYDFSGLDRVADEIIRKRGTFNNVKLLVLGRGELWQSLEEKRIHEASDRIILLNWVPYEEIPSFLAAADICILPAEKNKIMMNIVPIKMYEYMAAGKPVISTNLPGIRREFGDGNGVTYVEKPEQTVEKAYELWSRSELRELGLRSKAFACKYDWEVITNAFEEELLYHIHR